MFKRIFFLILSLILLLSCKHKTETFKAERYTLGTHVKLQFHTNQKKIKPFLKQFDLLSKKQTKDLYAWGNGWLASQNSFLEKAQCGLPVNSDTLLFFHKLIKLHQLSSGLFDPSIMPLVELWGFHNSNEMRSSPPSDKDIKQLRRRYGNMQDLKIGVKTICAERSLKIDLGGVAKGWAAEKTLDLLNDNGIKNALIGFGGDLIALGKKPDGSAWQVGLKNPDIHQEGFSAPVIFKIRKSETLATAIFTSGDYERQFEYTGKRAHHILDPRTGYPNTEVHSVTVIHPDPVLADAAATSLHVAGKNWLQLAKQMNLNNVLVLFPNKKAQITSSMADITTWLDKEYEVEIIAHTI